MVRSQLSQLNLPDAARIHLSLAQALQPILDQVGFLESASGGEEAKSYKEIADQLSSATSELWSVGERMARCPGDDDEKLVADAFGEAATPADGETADVQLQRLLRDFVNAHYTVEQQKEYPHLALDLWNDVQNGDGTGGGAGGFCLDLTPDHPLLRSAALVAGEMLSGVDNDVRDEVFKMLLREQAQTFFLFNDKPPARFGIAVTDDKGEWRHAEINMVQNATIDKNVPSPRTLFEDRLTADKAAEQGGAR